MNADSEYVRLEKWRILIPGCLLAPFVGYVLYVGFDRGLTISAIIFMSVVVIAGVAMLVNYLWLDYLLIDNQSVQRVQLLGLIRKEIPLGRITQVRKGRMTPLLFSYGSIRFCSSEVTIEVPYEAYERKELIAGLRRLRTFGVQMEQTLVRQFTLD